MPRLKITVIRKIGGIRMSKSPGHTSKRFLKLVKSRFSVAAENPVNRKERRVAQSIKRGIKNDKPRGTSEGFTAAMGVAGEGRKAAQCDSLSDPEG